MGRIKVKNVGKMLSSKALKKGTKTYNEISKISV